MTTEHSMGTSIMAVAFNGGVVIGADSRTTTGAYIANRVSDKLTEVSSRIYCCRSGSAADTQAVAEYVKYALDMHSIEIEDLPRVKTAANLFQQVIYQNKSHLLAGIIVAGWDKTDGGTVYSINLGGSNVAEKFSIGGSGSTYIYGFCDANFKEDMAREECEDFVVRALSLAMARDGSSGGIIRTITIDETGVNRKMMTPLEF